MNNVVRLHDTASVELATANNDPQKQKRLFDVARLKSELLKPIASKKIFLCYRLEYKANADKPSKIPYYAITARRRNGKCGNPDDIANLVTLEQAIEAVQHGRFDGVGIAFYPGCGVIGIDFDHCLSVGPDGKLVKNYTPAQKAVVDALGTNHYTEVSPSKTGTHILVLGDTESLRECGEVELFGNNLFLTLTGFAAKKPIQVISDSALTSVRATIQSLKNKPIVLSISSVANISDDPIAHPTNVIDPFPYTENFAYFFDALHVATPVPDERSQWLAGIWACCSLVVLQDWPESETRAACSAWSAKSKKHADSDFDKTWNEGVSRTARKLAEGGTSITTHRTILTIAAKKGHKSIALTSQVMPPLQAMQVRFSLFNGGGTIGIIDESDLKRKQVHCGIGALNVMRRPDGQLQIARALKEAYPQADEKAVIKEFLVSPATRQYDGFDFTPGVPKSGALNLWVGPKPEPVLGTWDTTNKFLLNVICAGDRSVYQYLIGYLAHALQRPQEKPGVMITLVGGQGIGKGTLFEIITFIWPATTLQTNRISDITGDFNDPLEGSMFILLDEATFAGDRRATDARKNIVTAPTVRINPKGQPQRTIPSVHRLINATNHAHVGQTDYDDRRDLTLRVSDIHKGDHGYWKALYAAMPIEIPAMMYDLIRHDLSGFNVRLKPDTAELIRQKLKSLQPLDSYWYECLYSGSILTGADWPDFIATNEVVHGAKELAKGARYHSQINAPIVADMMRRVCPGATRSQRKADLHRSRGFTLPELSACRLSFETYLGGQIEWTE